MGMFCCCFIWEIYAKIFEKNSVENFSDSRVGSMSVL